MQENEIRAIDWSNVTQEELVGYCRNWNCEKELFRKIVERALHLVFIDAAELAGEIGEDAHEVEAWLEGEGLPSEEWMLLILTDIIQVRLQTIRRRKLPTA